MIIIVWKIEDITKRNDPSRVQRVTAMRILRNGAVKAIGYRIFTFESDFQALMILLEANKALPAVAFTRHAMGGHAHGRQSLLDAKIAACHQL